MNCVRTSIAAFLLVGCASAQDPLYPLPTRGMYSSYSAGVVFEGRESLIGKKNPGIPARVDLFNNGRRNVPEYTTAQINACLNQISANHWPLSIEIDAMSTGNDLLPLYEHAPGRFRIYQGNVAGWATLCIAMSPDPVLGGDEGIFGYYFDNPSFPRQLSNGTYYEMLYSEFGSGALNVPDQPRIAALDIAMGLIDASEGRPVLGVNFETRRLYFSVTPTCAQLMSALLPILSLDDPNNPQSPLVYDPPGDQPQDDAYTGATVFVAIFDPNSGDCVDVRVHADYTTFDLDRREDIDALALARLNIQPSAPAGGTELALHSFQYVLSTADFNGSLATLEPEELFVVATPANGTRTKGTIRTGDDDVLVGEGGPLSGNVNGVCGDDPDGTGNGGNAGAQPHSDGNADAPPLLGLSAHATCVPYGPDGDVYDDMFQLVGIVSGWADEVPADSLVVVVVSLLGTGLPDDDISNEYLILPMRSSGDGFVEFTLDFGMPWTLANSTNQFEISAYQVRMSDWHRTDSIRVRLCRG